MPSPAPLTPEQCTAQLQALGAQIRAQRKALRLSATVTAEAAGLSRVTLHRIEKGEPSVTMGAYLNVMEALGLALLVGADATPVMTGPEAGPLERSVRPESPEPQAAPNEIPLDSYPELRRLAWQVAGAQTLTAQEALAVYERNWRHLDTAALQASERQLIDDLARQHGHGRLLV